MVDPFSGNLLVASSTVEHPIYSGGVCLLVHQDIDHTIGVMLNRPMIPPQWVQATSQAQPSSDSPNAEIVPPDSGSRYIPTGSQHHSFFTASAGIESVLEDPNHDAASFGAAEPTDPQLDSHPTDSEQDDASESGIQQALIPLGPLPQGSNLILPPNPLHFGGPVSGPVVALHQHSDLAEMEMEGGIFVAAQRDNLERLVHQKQSPYRLIVGHLRWDDDALEREIEAGYWHSLPATAEQVFSSAQGMWPRLIRRATSRSMARWVKTQDVPNASLLN